MSREFHLDAHPIVLMRPRVTAPFGWVGHIPFAYLAVELLKPRCLVELGTHSGNSYLAFCQAVRKLELPTRCWAVDSWEGDEHASLYGDHVYEALRAVHGPLYGDFSQLMRMRFGDAVNHFDDGSIDLLHIDGLHTYEAVRQDFELWKPKLSRSAVVLMHDTSVRERGFGVRQYFDELSASHVCFDFHHSHGLGVVVVGDEVPEAFMAFMRRAAEQPQAVRTFFESLGDALIDPGDGATVQVQPAPVVAHLFYRSNDQGYDESRAIPRLLGGTADVMDVNFRLPEGVSPDFLRLDFSDLPGIYQLRSVTLRRGDRGKVLDRLRERLGYVHGEQLASTDSDDVRIASFDYDPYLEFDVASALPELGGDGSLEVTMNIGYELLVDDPRLQRLLERRALSLNDLAHTARQRIDLREIANAQHRLYAHGNAVLEARFGELARVSAGQQDQLQYLAHVNTEQLGHMAARIQQLEVVVSRLAKRNIWSWLRRGLG